MHSVNRDQTLYDSGYCWNIELFNSYFDINITPIADFCFFVVFTLVCMVFFFMFIGWLACWFARRITTKLEWRMCVSPEQILLIFGADPDKGLDM